MRSAPCLDLILSRKRFQRHSCIFLEKKVNWETGEIKQSKWILTQVSLVAVMGGGYPSSEVMWPFGSEFNFNSTDCGKVTNHLTPYLPACIHQCCMDPMSMSSLLHSTSTSAAWATPWNVEGPHSKLSISCPLTLVRSSWDLRCISLAFPVTVNKDQKREVPLVLAETN